VTRNRTEVGEGRCDKKMLASGGTVMKALFNRFVREEAGQDLIEYALLAGFISLACALIIEQIGTSLNTLYGNVKTQVDSAAS
jgi:pilus assembly protein Flp/PilA